MDHEESHWENEGGAVAEIELLAPPCAEGDHSCLEHKKQNCVECADSQADGTK